ncbi:MAG: hypothetical protein AB7D27_15290, partial [Desulfomicrobium sp.]
FICQRSFSLPARGNVSIDSLIHRQALFSSFFQFPSQSILRKGGGSLPRAPPFSRAERGFYVGGSPLSTRI